MPVYKSPRVRRSGFRKAEDFIDEVDRQILEFLERVACPVCPPSIAINIRQSPTDTRVRCQTLNALGLIDAKDLSRKAFSLNPLGEDFLAGNISLDRLYSLSDG